MTAAANPDTAPLLVAEGLVAGFGPTTVLYGVSFSVGRGEVAGVFGLNGAGKSVTMKVLAGTVAAREGRVLFDGDDITSLAAETRVARGIAHVPQGRQVFGALTVEENLRLGAYTLRKRDRGRYPQMLDAVYDRFPLLAERRSQVAGTLSGGQQAALAVGRALVCDPKLILVDEPSAGLAPMAVQDLFGTLRAVAESGVTMVLVEQNVTFGLQVVDTVNVLQTGTVVLRSDVATVDHDELASALGIGRLLRGGMARAMTNRTPQDDSDGSDDSPPAEIAVATTTKAAAPAQKNRAVAKKTAATKKVTAPKKAAKTKKIAATKKTAPKRAATTKKVAAKTTVAGKKTAAPKQAAAPKKAAGTKKALRKRA